MDDARLLDTRKSVEKLDSTERLTHAIWRVFRVSLSYVESVEYLLTHDILPIRRNKVLQMSAGLEYPGGLRWELVACLICAWILVYFAIWKSIKSSSKVRYFTATLPFVLIIIFLGRALTLDGAQIGLRYFFRPNWALLGNANVWINAAAQNFNSLGIAFGSMISFASYNKYNNNFLHDTLAVSFVNAITSLLVGIFAFATIGNIALEQSTSVEDVISDGNRLWHFSWPRRFERLFWFYIAGPGLIFVVYPQALAKMPLAQMWAVMFFFMLLCLGLNSQVSKLTKINMPHKLY